MQPHKKYLQFTESHCQQYFLVAIFIPKEYSWEHYTQSVIDVTWLYGKGGNCVSMSG